MAQVFRHGRSYGTGRPAWLTPLEVRTWEFDPRRRGIDPEQVRAFQRRVSDELAELHRMVARANEENDRLKRALRDWQAMHAERCQGQRDPRGNSGRHW
ncbi:DivIVA domain-containing protein [Micromonospora sp. CPCC 206060]|uniref:DivIVA domain-containing protein n=1 Tax=Micromonospora sp. CPCC 206060 TaxID=3122406 RepID=UPI002FF40792